MKQVLILFALLITSYSHATLGRTTISDQITRYKNTTEEVGILFFKGTWQEALNKAQAEKKMVFLDAYASWCGPCKTMARTTFKEEAVGLYFNEHFINVKMDMEKDVEGPRLSKKYKLTAYPSLYFLNSNEELVSYTMGAYKAKALVKYAKEVIRLASPN